MSDYTHTVAVSDLEEHEIRVGTRVRYFDGEDTGQTPGTVTKVSDFDGDVDDDTGRSIMIAPSVTVRWDDGGEDTFPTSDWSHQEWNYDEDGAPMSCDSRGYVEELIVVELATKTF